MKTGAAQALALFVLLSVPSWLIFCAPAAGQSLSGQWVEETQKQIQAHRTAKLRVIVLDAAGQPAPMAQVRVAMKRHAFPFGFWYDPAAPAGPMDQPVWRCFSAVSLEPITGWAGLVPHGPQDLDLSAIDRALAWCAAASIPTVRWGPLLDLELGRTPAWLSALTPKQEAEEVRSYVTSTLRLMDRRIDQFDLLASQADDQYLSARHGEAYRRLLHQEATAAGARAKVCVRFDGALFGPATRDMAQRVIGLQETFVPFDEVASIERLDGSVVHAPLTRALAWLEPLDKPVVVAGLEVAGPSGSAAAVNLETTLRVLFASPVVSGIYFMGVKKSLGADPSAALVDERNEPTPAGRVFDALVGRLWWTDLTLKTDARGSASATVFAGRHELTATLGDGSVAAAPLVIAAGEDRIVILQFNKPRP